MLTLCFVYSLSAGVRNGAWGFFLPILDYGLLFLYSNLAWDVLKWEKRGQLVQCNSFKTTLTISKKKWLSWYQFHCWWISSTQECETTSHSACRVCPSDKLVIIDGFSQAILGLWSQLSLKEIDHHDWHHLISA